MSDETANLILEQLRIIRAEIASVKAELKEELRALRERVGAMDAQLTGLSYLVTTGLGAVLHDMKDLKERVAVLEATH